MLTFKIRLPEVPNPSTEEVYSNAVGMLFPDNVRTFHGDPGSHITYLSGTQAYKWPNSSAMAVILQSRVKETLDGMSPDTPS